MAGSSKAVIKPFKVYYKALQQLQGVVAPDLLKLRAKSFIYSNPATPPLAPSPPTRVVSPRAARPRSALAVGANVTVALGIFCGALVTHQRAFRALNIVLRVKSPLGPNFNTDHTHPRAEGSRRGGGASGSDPPANHRSTSRHSRCSCSCSPSLRALTLRCGGAPPSPPLAPRPALPRPALPRPAPAASAPASAALLAMLPPPTALTFRPLPA